MISKDLKRKIYSWATTRGGYLAGIYLILLLYFLIWHGLFLLFNYKHWPDPLWKEFVDVCYHGLKLDSVVSAYMLPIPFISLLLIYILPRRGIDLFLRVYYAIIGILLAIIFTSDLLLYGYWHFRLDSTPLFYLRHPTGAIDSVNAWMIIGAALGMAVAAALLIRILWGWHRRFLPEQPKHRRYTFIYTPGYFLMAGLIFVLIRGGLSVATANVGMVYHSEKQFLNHAAINPAFSLVYSLKTERDFTKGYLFFDEKTLAQNYDFLAQQASADTDPNKTEKVLTHNRPHVILLLLESFSANPIGALGNSLGLTPHIDSLVNEGLLFEQTYANSFRTDRGMASILSAFPAQPKTSIIKYPAKCQSLPSIARSLSANGYTTHMLYGGDINFAGMRSYLTATGYRRIVDLSSFDAIHRLSKWGVPDEITLEYLAKDYLEQCRQSNKPVFYTMLTLSSHEPFDVPTKRNENPYLNSIAYTDEALGHFVSQLKRSSEWENTLLILIGDHGYPYPEDKATPDRPEKYRILHLWAGGALEKKGRLSTICSQTDVAATLLSQMGFDHSDMPYSKNILSAQVEPYAFFSVPNLFGFVDKEGITTWDCDSKQTLFNEGTHEERRILLGKAYLQNLLMDVSKR